jgi:hypothetical protein
MYTHEVPNEFTVTVTVVVTRNSDVIHPFRLLFVMLASFLDFRKERKDDDDAGFHNATQNNNSNSNQTLRNSVTADPPVF